MKSFKNVFSAGCFLCLGLVSPAWSQLVSTASVLPDGSVGSNFTTGAGVAIDGSRTFDNRKMQLFRATVSGSIETLSIRVHDPADPSTVPLRASIVTLDGNQPDQLVATSLLTESLPDQLPFGGTELNASFYFAEPTMLPPTFGPGGPLVPDGLVAPALRGFVEAGTDYGIIFSTDSVDANYRLFGLRASGFDYPDGEILRFQNSGPYETSRFTPGSNLAFNLLVDPVFIPEPGTGALLLAAALGFIWRRRVAVFA
ncbi:MAG: PEP-CTERM sorting domain-containing protein [Verrucomicrobiota bacterium]